MRLHSQFTCLLPEECPDCCGQDYSVGGNYPDSESGFEPELVVCQICGKTMDMNFIRRNAESIADKAEPYGALRQDYADMARESFND